MDDHTSPPDNRGSGLGLAPADCSPQELLAEFSAGVLALLGTASPSRAVLLDALTACYGVMDRPPFDEEIRRDPQGRHLLHATGCLGHLILAGRRAEDGPYDTDTGTGTGTDGAHGAQGVGGVETESADTGSPADPLTDDEAQQITAGGASPPAHGPQTRTHPSDSSGTSPQAAKGLPGKATAGAVREQQPSTARRATPRPTTGDRLQEAIRKQYIALLDDVDARGWLDSPADLLRLRPAEEPEITPPVSAGDYWRLSHVALLRLPDDQRIAWHIKLSAAARASVGLRRAGERSGPPREEGIDDPDVLVPTLVDHSGPVLLSLAPTANGKLPSDLPAELSRAAGLLGGPAAAKGTEADRECRRRWAVRAHQAMQLARLDPLLVLRWKGQNIGVTKAVENFQQLLVDHLTSLSASQRVDNAENRFRAEHRLDALIGSVLHTTPASQESWWWRWRAAGWSELAKSATRAGYSLHHHPERLQREQLLALTGSGEEDNLTGRKGAPRALQWVLYALAGSQDGKGIGAVVIRPR
ncbi:hypothetical protein ACFQ61_28260 [Streptomyces sp. NPDC056500]|uniref:hypothetical protein n=1 Tax=Streptomyces sp. NPDC056500 TaxID=3345840 RepID=UPI0036B8495C